MKRYKHIYIKSDLADDGGQYDSYLSQLNSYYYAENKKKKR